MLERIAPRIVAAGIPVVSIRDSIVVAREHAQTVASMMERERRNIVAEALCIQMFSNANR
jgi:hypothetical protein